MGYEQEAPFRSNGNTFDCTVADFNNDGYMDCFIGEITHWWAGPSSDKSTFLINGGPDSGWKFTRTMLGIERIHKDDHWNQGDIHTGAIDFDNDGLLDLLIASSDYPDGQYLKLYKQLPDHTFTEVTEMAGFDWEGCGGLSICDYDRDGDEDILIGKSFMRLPAEKTAGKIAAPALFQNNTKNGNHWIGVICRGSVDPDDPSEAHSKVSAIGARITASCGDKFQQTREILGGAGHAGHQNPPEVHFGLGQNTMVTLEIIWPDLNNTDDVFYDLPVDNFVLLDESTHSYQIMKFDGE
jgi:enediyne biosynthesis protein E4